MRRVFLLSPASLAGRRAELLLRETATFELANRLRVESASLGEIFSFISGLYFRGKLSYASAFCEPTSPDSIFVITAAHGLLPPDVLIGRSRLCEMAQVPISASEPRYRIPLDRDLARLATQLGKADEIVLLGSIATRKYLEPLLGILGDRIMIPAEFVGRGDMSRGSLMLRAVRDRTPLAYMSAKHLDHA
ncbi:MAG: hypothetical protein WAL95_03700 [Candidatus Acidiferrales bacterium]